MNPIPLLIAISTFLSLTVIALSFIVFIQRRDFATKVRYYDKRERFILDRALWQKGMSPLHKEVLDDIFLDEPMPVAEASAPGPGEKSRPKPAPYLANKTFSIRGRWREQDEEDARRAAQDQNEVSDDLKAAPVSGAISTEDLQDLAARVAAKHTEAEARAN